MKWDLNLENGLVSGKKIFKREKVKGEHIKKKRKFWPKGSKGIPKWGKNYDKESI